MASQKDRPVLKPLIISLTISGLILLCGVILIPDLNIRQILARSGQFPIRIASKSVRCRHILAYILQSNTQFQGIMSFSSEEAIFLSELMRNAEIRYLIPELEPEEK